MNTVVDISKKTIDELKVMAFDEIRSAERLQNNIKIIVSEINKRESGEVVNGDMDKAGSVRTAGSVGNDGVTDS